MNGLREGVKAAWDGSLSPLFEEFSAGVQVEVLDPTALAVDPLYGEPVAGKQYLSPVTVKARVGMEHERLVKPGGEMIDTDGRVVLRTEELTAAGVGLDFSSLITVSGRKYAVAHIETAAQVGEEHLLTKVWLREG